MTEYDEPKPTVIRVPVLTTPRLTLRAFEERDVEPYAAMLSHPEVAQFLGDSQPLTPTDAWCQIAMIVGHWALRGFGFWAVVERESGALVGRAVLLEPAGWPGFELAYALGRPFWSRGYAREGAREALQYAQTALGRSEVISIIRPANTASIRVAAALGARRGETVDFLGAPSHVYRYPGSEGASHNVTCGY